MTIQVPGYKIQKQVGEGGMASVFLATQECLNRSIALKILKKFDNKAQITRFFNEGKFIASLNHPNIITIHDLGEVNGRCFLAMEYIAGGALNQYINKGLKPDEATQLIKLIANCLDFVHQNGIIHRDIKPENILFRKDRTPILTDFGVAKQIQSDTSLTMDGMTIGSPHYMSPEQAEHKPLDARTDIYSLGIVLYEMLTGQKPFQGNSPIETIIAHLTTKAAPLPKHLEKYQELLDIMIAKDAADRFKSAAELADFLGKLQSSTPLHALTKKLNKVISSTGKNTKHLGNNPSSVKNVVGIAKDAADRFNSAAELADFLGKLQSSTPLHALTKKLNKVISSTGKNAKHLVNNPLSVKNVVDSVKAHSKRLWPGIILTVILSFSTYYFSSQNDAISFNLAAAEKALLTNRLVTPEKDNASFFIQEALKETLRLDPNNPEAQQGKIKIANAYADLVEINLNTFQYDAAKSNLYKGLAIHPTSSRLLALKKLKSIFD